jgi:hypothetical protein
MKPRDRATDGPGGLTGAALFRQAQASCRDSLARLMAVHEGLVHAVVRKQVLGHLPLARPSGIWLPGCQNDCESSSWPATN